MNTIIFAVIFPLIAGFFLWLLFRNKRLEGDRSALSIAMIAVSVIELAAVVNLFVCDLTGVGFDRVWLGWGVGGLGLSFRYTGFRGIFGMQVCDVFVCKAVYEK